VGKQSTSQQIFKQVLQKAEDVTDTFDIDLGHIPQDVVDSRRQAEPHIRNVRELMEAKALTPDVDLSTVTNGLINMAAWAEVYGTPIREALRTGDVAAIDGTPLLHFQRFLTAQVYACAIGSLTYRDHLALKAQVVKTQAEPGLFQDQAATKQLIDETERLSSSQSWPSAFMEYQERKTALRHKAKYVLIDGPGEALASIIGARSVVQAEMAPSPFELTKTYTAPRETLADQVHDNPEPDTPDELQN